MRVLFILKRRAYGPSYGLMKSCQFVAELLRLEGIDCKIVEVTDNNCIDREVTRYRPSHVIIEALWVVPQKFPLLLRLHPDVSWAVRVHSNMPFISGEGMAMDWLRKYGEIAAWNPKFRVAANSQRMTEELDSALGLSTAFLPNAYSPVLIGKTETATQKKCHKEHLDIGCFGAIRPLKNHLEQAVAAVIFARQEGKPLRFHINASRVEQHAEPVLRNLIALFDGTINTLIQHRWMPHAEFMKVVQDMDYGMQVSFSETFNIVAADFVYNEVPFVGSGDIPWLSAHSVAETTDWRSIVEKLSRSRSKHIIRGNKKMLKQFSLQSVRCWLAYLWSSQ